MKEIGLDTVGGRIRKVRQEAKQSMPTFATKLDISSNYVGLIERGERNPSPELLHRVSSVMGVPYGWLANGGPLPTQSQNNRIGKNTADVASDPARAINPQLYLSIVLAMVPKISKDMLATILAAPTKTIDGLLTGKALEYDPRWSNGYSVLARNLDLPTLRRDLHNLDIFLEREETSERNMSLLRALKQYATETYEVHSINAQAPDAVPINIPYTDIVLMDKKEDCFKWYFKCLPKQDNPEDFIPADVLYNAGVLAEQHSCRVSIVLTSKSEFDYMCRHYDKLEKEDSAIAELGVPNHLPSHISIIFFNITAEEISDVREFPEDDDLDV